MERIKSFGKRRFVVQAHPAFRGAVKDFQQRWASAGHDALYKQAALRISHEFMRCYRLLIERTGDNPGQVKELLGESQPELAFAFKLLNEINCAITDPDEYGEGDAHIIAKATELGRSITQFPEFREALNDFGVRWEHSYEVEVILVEDLNELLDDDIPFSDEGRQHILVPWDPPFEVRQSATDWLRRLFESMPNSPALGESSEDPPEPRPFDPNRDSADAALSWLVYLFGEDPLFVKNFGYSADAAFRWLTKTVGLNLHEIECRWKAFPVIVVPQHVSDQHGLEEPRRLYGQLTQIRLAYMIGADLAAIALCRSVTELLIRYYYGNDIPNATDGRKTRLRWLIKTIQERNEFEYLKRFNLIAKVNEANDILHQANTDIEHQDRERGLVMEWVRVLEEMIDTAPVSDAGAAEPA